MHVCSNKRTPVPLDGHWRPACRRPPCLWSAGPPAASRFAHRRHPGRDPGSSVLLTEDDDLSVRAVHAVDLGQAESVRARSGRTNRVPHRRLGGQSAFHVEVVLPAAAESYSYTDQSAGFGPDQSTPALPIEHDRNDGPLHPPDIAVIHLALPHREPGVGVLGLVERFTQRGQRPTHATASTPPRAHRRTPRPLVAPLTQDTARSRCSTTITLAVGSASSRGSFAAFAVQPGSDFGHHLGHREARPGRAPCTTRATCRSRSGFRSADDTPAVRRHPGPGQRAARPRSTFRTAPDVRAPASCRPVPTATRSDNSRPDDPPTPHAFVPACCGEIPVPRCAARRPAPAGLCPSG
jgi:hypothetical protein